MSNKHALTLAHQAGTYDSEFEYDSEAEKRRKKYVDLSNKEKKKKPRKGHKRELEDEYDKEEGRIMRHRLVSLNASILIFIPVYFNNLALSKSATDLLRTKETDHNKSVADEDNFDRHRVLVNNYLMYYGGAKADFKRDSSRDKTDMDVIRENHKFLWTEEDDADQTWSKRLAKKYYDKLFKEYCISDLNRYKENKIAMRWRIDREVQEGKGQFICGNKKCQEGEGLRSWEVNFAYMEDGDKKNALVKLRLCPDCSYKLNYHHRKREVVKPKKSKHKDKKHKKHKRDKDDTSERDDGAKQTDEAGTSEADTEPPESTAENQKEEVNIWAGPAKVVEEKSREEEFDDYFEDMFL